MELPEEFEPSGNEQFDSFRRKLISAYRIHRDDGATVLDEAFFRQNLRYYNYLSEAEQTAFTRLRHLVSKSDSMTDFDL